MKRTNSTLVVARLMLIVLSLAITVFSFASCDSLPPEIQGLLGGNPNASCEHEYDNACDFYCNKCNAALIGFPEHAYDNDCDTDCNICGVTRETEHVYDNGVCSVCGAVDESVPECQHTNVENCVCKDCNKPTHPELELLEAYAPTCEKDGISADVYICMTCGKGYLEAEAKTEVRPIDVMVEKLGHNYIDGTCDRCGQCQHLNMEECVCKDCNKTVHFYMFSSGLGHMPAASATCEKNGNLECYTCTRCLGFFYDSEGENKANYKDILIPALGHNYVDGACDRCGAIECEHTTIENCVCKDCNASVHIEVDCMPAMAPSCGDIGIRYDVYTCYNCGKFFYDSESKNEMTDVSSVIIAPLGHKMVGSACERCGSSGGLNGGNNGTSGNPTPFELACSQLGSLYRPDNKKATPSDYELVSKIVIEGEVFEVTWTIANESISLTYDADKDVYIVDVPDEVTKNCYYSIEAAILNNSNGRTVKYNFVRLLEATVNTDGEGDSSVCQHKSLEYLQATPDIACNYFGVLFDIYVCCDCLDIFYDAECKNKVPYDTTVTISPTAHKEVGGICEKCGYYPGEGDFPSHGGDETPFDTAYFDIIDLYSANHKEATMSDYELISMIVVEGEEFAVTWTVANESITVTYDADKDVYVVNVPDEVSEKCYYSITATISDGEGNTGSFMFARVLMPSEE